MSQQIPISSCTAKPADTGLINVYSTRNLGDAAIMSAIGQMHPRGIVHAATNRAEDEIGVRSLAWADSISDCRNFISVGGDIFNNARPNYVTRAYLNNVWQLYRHRHQSLLFGQTIPTSCRGAAYRILAGVLQHLPAVVVRDAQSFADLREQGVAAELSFDAAFALGPTLAGVRAARELFEDANLEPRKTALVSIRSFDSIYGHDQAEFLGKIGRLIDNLEARGHQVGILIQSDVTANDTDRHLAHDLARDNGATVLDLFSSCKQGDDIVERLHGVLAIANIAVAVRYHTAVLRLAAGRVPYNLSYSRKGEDLSSRLNLPGSRLDDFDPDNDIASIEATASQAFDVPPIRDHVRQSFEHAYRTLQ